MSSGDFTPEKAQFILDKKLTLNENGYELSNIDSYLNDNGKNISN